MRFYVAHTSRDFFRGTDIVSLPLHTILHHCTPFLIIFASGVFVKVFGIALHVNLRSEKTPPGSVKKKMAATKKKHETSFILNQHLGSQSLPQLLRNHTVAS